VGKLLVLGELLYMGLAREYFFVVYVSLCRLYASVSWSSASCDEKIVLEFAYVSLNYLNMLDISLLQGQLVQQPVPPELCNGNERNSDGPLLSPRAAHLDILFQREQRSAPSVDGVPLFKKNRPGAL